MDQVALALDGADGGGDDRRTRVEPEEDDATRAFDRRIQKPKSFDRKPKKKYTGPKDTGLSVYVREGNVDRALRTFKKKVKNANIMQDLKDREFFQTRREKRRLLKDKAIRRQKRENENNKGLGFTKRGRFQ